MAGTTEGGKKVAALNKQRYGEDFYVRIGKQGGVWDNPSKRYFARNRQAASQAGRKGGTASRRSKGKNV